jgi:hypothetical protein
MQRESHCCNSVTEVAAKILIALAHALTRCSRKHENLMAKSSVPLAKCHPLNQPWNIMTTMNMHKKGVITLTRYILLTDASFRVLARFMLSAAFNHTGRKSLNLGSGRPISAEKLQSWLGTLFHIVSWITGLSVTLGFDSAISSYILLRRLCAFRCPASQ